jgi:hypothetical protein
MRRLKAREIIRNIIEEHNRIMYYGGVSRKSNYFLHLPYQQQLLLLALGLPIIQEYMNVTVTYPPFQHNSLFDGIGKRPDGYKLNTDKLQINDLMEGVSLTGKHGLIESQVTYVEERLRRLVREHKQY